MINSDLFCVHNSKLYRLQSSYSIFPSGVQFVQIVLRKMYKFFSETTFHGLNHIQKDKPWVLQLFWFIAFLTSASVASVLFYYQIQMYRSKPIATEYRIISANTMQLPTLGVCTKYPMKATKMLELNISKALGSILNAAYSLKNPLPEDLKSTLEEYNNLMIKLNASNFAEVRLLKDTEP